VLKTNLRQALYHSAEEASAVQKVMFFIYLLEDICSDLNLQLPGCIEFEAAMVLLQAIDGNRYRNPRWTIEDYRILRAGAEVAARVLSTYEDVTFFCFAFHTILKCAPFHNELTSLSARQPAQWLHSG